jgi:dCMP deaminase
MNKVRWDKDERVMRFYEQHHATGKMIAAMAYKRTTRDELYMAIAKLIASRSTCLRRAVGCVLVDTDGFILSTGYNGVAAGRPHCNEPQLWAGIDRVSHPNACPGAQMPSGQGLDKCEAIHAEQNAILRLPDPRKLATVYVTASPCVSCVKLFLGTACSRIVFAEAYPHPQAETWWREAGRDWIQQTP